MKKQVLTNYNYKSIISDIEKLIGIKKTLIQKKRIFSLLAGLLANDIDATINIYSQNKYLILDITGISLEQRRFFEDLDTIQRVSVHELEKKFRESIARNDEYKIELYDLGRTISKTNSNIIYRNEQIVIKIPVD